MNKPNPTPQETDDDAAIAAALSGVQVYSPSISVPSRSRTTLSGTCIGSTFMLTWFKR
jgi:hypothetical protein